MKNSSAGEMSRVYLVLVSRLRNAGVSPKMHILDNKCSEEFKAQIGKNNMTFQLAHPHDYRRNIAEKAIQTFKGHFISILCGADKQRVPNRRHQQSRDEMPCPAASPTSRWPFIANR